MLDKSLYLSEKQAIFGAVTEGAREVISENAVDLIDTERAIPNGVLCTMMTTALEGTGTVTARATLQTSSDNSTWEDVVSTPDIAAGKLTEGKWLWRLQLPAGLKRYFRVKYDMAGTTLTAGAVSTFITNIVPND